ncbi:MAG: choice-of-anchor Q domain-containing protein [Planctomycetota bacterium]|jgi:hypothetical protein
MCNIASSSLLINCVLVGNTAEEGDWPPLASGIWSTGASSPALVNTIVYDNDYGSIADSDDATTSVLYCNVQGGWPGTGNIDSDPMFVDPDNGDLRLSPGSPCIDAGHNNAIAGLADTDLDGNPRFADDPGADDIGCGVPVVVDMGAYEYQGNPADVTFADLNGDNVVGLDDFDALMNCWSSSEEPCCIADLDLNGTVNVVDFLILLANWG